MKLEEQSPEVAAMNAVYSIVEDVTAGTIRMREKAADYLPRRRREQADDYDKRVRCAVLFGGTNATLSALVGRAFAEPLAIEDAPTWFEPIADNIDSRGKRLGVWAEEWLKTSVKYGSAWAIVDAPAMPAGLSRQEQAGAQPYAVAVSPRSVLGWVYDGSKLVQLRLEWAREERMQFGSKTIRQIRVYNLANTVTLDIYEQSSGERKEWVLVDSLAIASSRIPAVRCELASMPPLLELAHHEIQLFQRESSADSLIDVAEVPILVVVGSQLDGEIQIGASQAIKVNQGGDVRFAEHSGRAIESGRQYRQDIKQAMRQIGAKFVEPKNGAIKTATQANEESANENSDLANIVIRFSDACTDLIDLIAEFAGQTEQGTVKMRPNLKTEPEPANVMTTISGMVNNGILSKQTAFEIAKGLGLGIGEDIQWADEQARIGEQPDAV